MGVTVKKRVVVDCVKWVQREKPVSDWVEPGSKRTAPQGKPWTAWGQVSGKRGHGRRGIML